MRRSAPCEVVFARHSKATDYRDSAAVRFAVVQLVIAMTAEGRYGELCIA